MSDDDCCRVFRIPKSHEAALVAWQAKHNYHPQGAIGGSTTYKFVPTSIGTVIKVKCCCGDEIDLSNYGSW